MGDYLQAENAELRRRLGEVNEYVLKLETKVGRLEAELAKYSFAATGIPKSFSGHF